MSESNVGPGAEPWLQVTASRNFTAWLADQDVSLACTTYQTGKLLLIGRKPDGRPSVFERSFQRCLGLWADGQTLWLSTPYQLWRFENLLTAGVEHAGHDRLYVPKTGHTTGDLDIHDLAVTGDGRLVFVATRFNSLAALHERWSFTPLWQPPFISQLAREDRCHLNGLALEEGWPRYVTAVGTSDVVDGWRGQRRDGGVVVDVQADQTIVTGLSLPHSPRVHEGRLWLLNSGTGEFGFVAQGRFEPVAFGPGYLRGLACVGPYAVIGLSRPRHDSTFDLPLHEALQQHGVEARCGLLIVDLRTGDAVEWVRFEGQVSELYDVAVLPGVVRPMVLGFKTEELQRLIAVGEPAPLFPAAEG